MTSQDHNQEQILDVNRVKKVWGSSDVSPVPTSQPQNDIKPSTFSESTQPAAKKKEVAKPVDEKKEKMKNLLFSGINNDKEDSD